MLILGHYLLTQNSNFCFIDESKKLKKDQISCFLYNEEIIQNAKNENLDFAVLIQDKNEIFLSNALGAKFLLFDDENLARFASDFSWLPFPSWIFQTYTCCNPSACTRAVLPAG